MSRVKRWTWTLNQPTSAETSKLESLIETLDENIKYLCYGREVAPTTGCVHYQGYATFTSKKSMRQVKRLLGSNRLHLEKSKGTGAQNREYCSKDGDFKEAGLIQNQGQRNDLEQVRTLVKDGASQLEIADAHFGTWLRYHKSIEMYRKLVHQDVLVPRFELTSFPPLWQPITVETSLILWGEPGIGKTCFAATILPGALMVSHMDDLAHFNSDVHSGIIFDDMDFNHLPRTSQIHILDYDYARSIHIRYQTASIPANTKKIFTTNDVSGRIFDISDGAIKRRVVIEQLIKPSI